MHEHGDRELFLLPEAESSRIFANYIAPYLFGDVRPSRDKKVIFVGGQPGAGKTVLLGHLLHEEPDQVVGINGDDLRAFHPQYTNLLDRDDKSAAFFTDGDAAKWTEMAIKFAAEEAKCSVGIEGTFRQSKVVVDTAQLFKSSGYTIEVDVLLAHPLISRLGIAERYTALNRILNAGRFTIREAHDNAYNNLPDTVEQLLNTSIVDKFSLFGRGGRLLEEWPLVDREGRRQEITSEVMEMVNTSRKYPSKEEIKYLITALPRIEREAREIGKIHLLDEVESIKQEVLQIRELAVN